MTEIGVERLGAGDGEEYRAEGDEPDHAVRGEKRDGIAGIEGEQDLGIAGDERYAGDGDGDEPHRGDRTEERRDLGGAARLHGEQRDQDHDGQRHDVVIEGGGDELEAFDRGQHRQRRRDDGVAVEQRRADDAAEHDRAGALAERALRQRHERERAALPLVVRPQQDEHVFERDHDDQRPQDQREHAEHGIARQGAAGGCGRNRFTKRIERARSDVAVDDTDAADGQRPEAGARARLAVPVGGDYAAGRSRKRGTHGLFHLRNAALQYRERPRLYQGRNERSGLRRALRAEQPGTWRNAWSFVNR